MIIIETANPQSFLNDILSDVKSGHIHNVKLHTDGVHLTITTGTYGGKGGFDYKIQSNPNEIIFKLYDFNNNMSLFDKSQYHITLVSALLVKYGLGIKISGIHIKL